MTDHELLMLAKEVLPPAMFMLLLGAVIVRQFISWRRESPPVVRPTLVPPTPTRDPCDGLREEIVALRSFITGMHDGTRAKIDAIDSKVDWITGRISA